MSDNDPVDWSATTFDGSRQEQLRHTRAMTVRQRLEAMDALNQLSERMQAMPKQPGGDNNTRAAGGRKRR